MAPFPEYTKALDERIELFPETAELYDKMRIHANPQQAAPWARSIVVCVRRCGKYDVPKSLIGHIARHYLVDQRARQSPDYGISERMLKGLRALELRAKVGNIPARLAAVRAGVARIGRNGFAYSDKYGSWMRIGSWLIDAELPPDQPTTDCPCPESCRACMTACPTKAITRPFVMRMDHCVAYLTYSAPHPIAAQLWDKMGSWIYGCDACQQVCPLNKDKWEPLEKTPWLEEAVSKLTPEALACMDAQTYRQIVHPLFWYIPVEDLDRWHANARRALEHRRSEDARPQE